MFEELRSVLPHTAEVDDAGQLRIGGVSAREIVDAVGSPVLVLDEAHVRANARAYVDGLAAAGAPAGSRVVFACKSLCNGALLRVLVEEGLGADVASGGELAIALRAGVDPANIVMHGNNKSRAELAAAVDAGVGLVVLDALSELDLLEEVAREAGARQPVLVRVNPDIVVETHKYIRTAHAGSKFGLDSAQALDLLERAHASDHLEARGAHVHLGSQLLDDRPWTEVIDWLATWAGQLLERGVPFDVCDLGGGLGISYLPHHPPPAIGELVAHAVGHLRSAWAREGIAGHVPQLIFEPGRSIVGQAGVSLYTVGALKESGGYRYCNVDGGMSDNPRPVLYQAEYRALLAERADEPAAETWWVAGVHCESGDVLIEDAPLPTPRTGELLAVAATGAYSASMASNYNAVPRPPIVLAAGGELRLAQRRETLDDLLGRECDEPVARATAPA
jgi:diaminopimelate decarboxylase